MAWSLDIQGPNGGANEVTDAPFQAFTATWTVEGPGAIEIDLTGSQVSTDWTAGLHRVVVNGDHGWAGYLENISQAGGPGEERWSVKGLGLQSRLDRRLVRHNMTLNDTSDVLVEALLDEAQAQYNGDMNFTMGTVTGTFPTRLRNYCFGVVIGDAIRELASLHRGFDWEVDENGALNLWGVTRGVDSAETLDPATITEVDIELDTVEMLTTVSAIGDPSQPFGPIHDMVRHVGNAVTYGRREIVIDVQSTDHDELIDAARAELKVGGGGVLRVHAGWWSDRGPWALGDVWLQDTAAVLLPDYLSGDQDMRCTDITVSVEPMADPDLYYVEQSFDALVADIDIDDTDPDEGS